MKCDRCRFFGEFRKGIDFESCLVTSGCKKGIEIKDDPEKGCLSFCDKIVDKIVAKGANYGRS
jgi:hypothetical protein